MASLLPSVFDIFNAIRFQLNCDPAFCDTRFIILIDYT